MCCLAQCIITSPGTEGNNVESKATRRATGNVQVSDPNLLNFPASQQQQQHKNKKQPQKRRCRRRVSSYQKKALYLIKFNDCGPFPSGDSRFPILVLVFVLRLLTHLGDIARQDEETGRLGRRRSRRIRR